MTVYGKNMVYLGILMIMAIVFVLVFFRGVLFQILSIAAIFAVGCTVLDDEDTMNRE